MKLTLALLVTSCGYATVHTCAGDTSQTGVNASETTLTQSVVSNRAKFGQLWSFSVDGNVFACPVLVDSVSIGGATSVLVVPTMHNSIYLLNALNLSQIWKINLGTSWTTYNTTDSDPYPGHEIGCLATPAVDQNQGASGVIYEPCVDGSGTWRLYAWNLLDGSNFLSPVAISGTFMGVTFTSSNHTSRPAVTLANGNVYIGFSGFEVFGGWIFAYSESGLSQVGIWSPVPSGDSGGGNRGGVWQSGRGFSVDGSGNVYAMIANGAWNGTTNYGESFVKLSSTLSVLDYFTPANWATLNSADSDIGSGGPVLVGSLVMGSGKDSRWWVLNQSALGDLQGGMGNPPIVQEFNSLPAQSIGNNCEMYDSYVMTSTALFAGASCNHVMGYTWNGSTFTTTAFASSAVSDPSTQTSSPNLSFSTNANAAGTSILWGVHDDGTGTANLRAYNPSTLAVIYNSANYPSDSLGTFAKFNRATIANGSVFVVTFSNTIVKFTNLPSSGDVVITGNVMITNHVNLQ